MKLPKNISVCVLTILLTTLFACEKQAEEEKPKPEVAVKTAVAEMAPIRDSVKAPAALWPRAEANVSARITAPISELRVKKGDTVSKGQVLAVLENRDVVAQNEESSAALADAEANLEKTQSGIVPSDIERGRGQLELAESSLNQMQKAYDRRRDLFKQGAIPERDLLQSQTDLAQAKTNYDVAKNSLDLLRNQSGAKDIQIANTRVRQAKAHLGSLKAQLQFTEITSPSDGTITDQFQYPGDMAQPATALFTVMDLSTVNARAQVPESDVSRIRPAQSCQFRPADTAIAAADGHVTLINKAVDPQRRTVEVWCEIPNRERNLRANMFGDVVFFTGMSNGVVVPKDAVQFNEGTNTGVVMVVDEKRTARKRDVEVGETRDDKVQIVKGINPGDAVIIVGGYSLPDGTLVTTGEPAK